MRGFVKKYVKKHKTKKPAEKFGLYFICSDCAKAKGWTAPSWPVTVTIGRCEYCESDEKKTLTPVVDFKRPGKVQEWD